MIFKGNSVLVSKKDNSVLLENEGDDAEFIPLMDLASLISGQELNNILKEYQVDNWKRRHNFCGTCGSKTTFDIDDQCMVCPKCQERFYQAMFPAIIVSIIKDDKILLAHNKNFPENLYSVVAGFVDIGENLEETVAREIREEVGIEVKNIKYFASQNWGFTSSLMLAFTAEYSSGEIVVDQEEIDRADWFTRENLPDLPPKISISRDLIDHYVTGM